MMTPVTMAKITVLFAASAWKSVPMSSSLIVWSFLKSRA